MVDCLGNREDAAIYGNPGTYGDIKAYTDNLNAEEAREEKQRVEYEKGFVYLPGFKTPYQEAKKYTEEIVKALK